jgi:hypothetical protein
LKLDNWQQECVDFEGDLCITSGRQSGKSTAIAQKVRKYCQKNRGKNILVIAAVERQAFLLFEKILYEFDNNCKKLIKKGKDRPTRSKLKLTNGCIIHCLPTGLSGLGIRGYTVDLLIADEAAFIPEAVWTAVTPMLATTKGRGGSIVLLSTPFGKGGYFYDCYKNPDFKTIHVSSEDCPRIDKNYLKREKERMTKVRYAQEYLGQFVDELMQFFSAELIESCMKLPNKDLKTHVNSSWGDNFLGVDVARKGADDTVLYSLKRKNKEELYEMEMEIIKNITIPDLARRIINEDKRNNYKKIYIDDGGLGVGVFDILKEKLRKVEAINNSSRSITRDDNRKKKILKEDLYTNLLKLMEDGKLHLKENPETALSLKSIQFEYTTDGNLKIFGKYSHIAEALIRAAWCMKDKALNIYIY